MSALTDELRVALRAWLDAPGDDLTAEAALVVAATTWFEARAAVAVPLADIDVERLARALHNLWLSPDGRYGQPIGMAADAARNIARAYRDAKP